MFITLEDGFWNVNQKNWYTNICPMVLILFGTGGGKNDPPFSFLNIFQAKKGMTLPFYDF